MTCFSNKSFALGLALPLLAACNATTTEGTDAGPTEAAATPTANTTTATTTVDIPTKLLAALGEQTFMSGGAAITNNNDGTFTVATSGRIASLAAAARSTEDILVFEQLNQFSNAVALFGALVDTPSVRAGIVTNSIDGAFAASNNAGAFYQRKTQTELPLAGTANLTGTYEGIIYLGTTLPAGQATNLVKGTTAVTDDFANSTVSGSITNRVDAKGGVSTWNDVTLAPATLTGNGTFAGTVSGGEFSANSAVVNRAGAGNYAGLVGGANGTEAVGTVLLDSQTTSGGITTNNVELGVFHADQ